MNLPFDEGKTAQAAAMFLKLRGGQMSYMKLIKLLYLADRTSLLKYGKPITMDRWYSMKHGPVLSNVLSLITDPSWTESSEGTWAQLISAPLEDHEVRLLSNTFPNDRLSSAEEKIITEVFDKYGHYNRWDLVELLHKGEIAPEWKEPRQGSRILIALSDVLKTELDPEEAELAEAELLSLVEAHRPS
jgi:uncharacterized phage-associated protein